MASDFLNQYKILYSKANSDLRIVGIVLKSNEEDVDIGIILFHLQQAAEKYLKAILSYSGTHYEKVHDITFLIETCVKNGIKLPEYTEELIELNPYAIVSRYDFFYNETDKNLVYKYYNLLKDFKMYTGKFIGEIY